MSASVLAASGISQAASLRRQQAGAAALRAPRLAAGSSGSGGSRSRRRLLVQAFRWDPRDPKSSEKIQDWRVQQMVELAHSYLVDFLVNKKAELAEQLLDENVVHTDVVWDPAHPTVGVQAMRHYQADLATAFPDFYLEVDQYATIDTQSLMVTYEGSATNLGEYHQHKPTRHASAFKGANRFHFNADRSRITAIDVYRSAFAEDLDEVGERRAAEEGGFRALRLRRLA